MGVATCIWLTAISGVGTALLSNQPLFSLPLPLPGNSPETQSLQQPPSRTYQVIGKPSLSASFVNRVLAQAHSPAAGTGQMLYALSVTSGIDDAYALAFFQHESNFGTTGIARITHSLGNIRCSPGYACLDGYRSYATWQAGYADWYTLIRTLYIGQWHLLTVAQIVPVYAPASDGNDVAAYITAVEQDVTRWHKGNATP
jgi:hypothetical protein